MSEDPTAGVIQLHEHGLAYRVRIRILHPTEPLDCITASTGVTPTVLQRAGDPRVNPSGKPLHGTFPCSLWGWSEEFRNSRDFSAGVARAIDIIAPIAELVSGLRSSGGQVEVILHLRGDQNIGAIIRSGELARMAALGIDFGIEIFPYTKD